MTNDHESKINVFSLKIESFDNVIKFLKNDTVKKIDYFKYKSI